MTEADNFKRARDNETDERYLRTEWTVFRDFDVKKTEHNAYLRAKWRDPGLPGLGSFRTAAKDRDTRRSGGPRTTTRVEATRHFEMSLTSF